MTLAGPDLVAFVAAVDAASVHGAADALHLTQSAVTKRLQALERRTGVRLLDRGRFGVRATAAGRVLYPEAKEALAALRRAEDSLAVHREWAGCALVISASHTIGEYLLPAWLARFRAAHPRMRAQVEIVNSPGVLEAVRERRAEIGFVEGHDALGAYETLTVHRDEIVVVVSCEHRWARRRSIAVRELLSEPYITREDGSGTRAVAGEALGRLGIELTPAIEAASTQSVKRTVASGGFALLSQLTVEDDEAGGTLRALPVRDLHLTRELRAVRDRRATPSAPARRFWNWLDGCRRAGGGQE
jgi:DNA-binding transcriptional LysR family regulator